MKLRTRHIILAFTRREDAENIRRILSRGGFYPAAVCSSGAQALAAIEDIGESVVVCGYRLGDMVCSELSELLPEDCAILLIANPSLVDVIPDNVTWLSTPLKQSDLLAAAELLVQGLARSRYSRRGRSGERSQEERDIIDEAKALLMERHRMSESEAHRYLQKRAMDNGCDLVETAQMMMTLDGGII